MKNKNYTICLNCGKVQIRTDIDKVFKDKYIVLEQKIKCPYCNIKTKNAITKNIKVLKRTLENSHKTQMDKHLYELIG